MNKYSITVSFGDGNPKTTTIEAANGYEARVKAFDSHPGARNVHVLGLSSFVPRKLEPYALLYAKDVVETKEKKKKIVQVRLEDNQLNPLVFEVIKLRQEGMSQQKIADKLGISRNAVRRLLEAHS